MTSIEEKRTRVEKFLHDLHKAITKEQPFPFGTKLTSHKVNWNANAVGIRALLINHDFIELKEFSANLFQWTSKAENVEIPDLAEIVVNLIEEKPAEAKSATPLDDESAPRRAPRERKERKMKADPVPAPQVQDEPEAELQELDEIEWGVIRFGLRKMIETRERYHDIASTILEKI